MSHDEVEELLGAYALDATDPEERAEVEAHLAECPRCRAEVEAHREMAAMFAGPGGDAPPALWEKIALSIAEDERRPGPRPEPVLPGAAVPLPTTPPARRRWRDAGLAGVVAVAAAALALLGTEVAHLSSQVDSLKSHEGQDALAQWLLEPHQTVALVSSDHAVVGHVFLNRSGQAVWYQSVLNALPGSETYQMWGLTRGQPVSLGLVGPDPHTLAPFRVGPATTKVMVTAEPAGGTAKPTTPVLAIGNVPTGYVG
jgi:anti-sigma-K factor RskA